MDLKQIYLDTKPEKFDHIVHKQIFLNYLCRNEGVGVISKIEDGMSPFSKSAIFLEIESFVPEFWQASILNDILVYNKTKELKAIAQICSVDFAKSGLHVDPIIGDLNKEDILFYRIHRIDLISHYEKNGTRIIQAQY